MDIKTVSLAASVLVLSGNVNAVVLNTLNGVDYEWLELTATQGLSRDQVELRLADVNDGLYGYQYASRQQVEDLFLSYTPWDGIGGWHGAPGEVAGMSNFFADFGALSSFAGSGVDTTFATVDGYIVRIDGIIRSKGFYGLSSECGDETKTCTSDMALYNNANGVATMAFMQVNAGWDANNISPSSAVKTFASNEWGSYLVRTSVVPVPAAVWLFGSGLFGLLAVAKRKVRA